MPGPGRLLLAAKRGIVPRAVFGAQQGDLGLLDGKAANVKFTVQHERFGVDADANVFGGEEWLIAEGWIVSDRRRPATRLPEKMAKLRCPDGRCGRARSRVPARCGRGRCPHRAGEALRGERRAARWPGSQEGSKLRLLLIMMTSCEELTPRTLEPRTSQPSSRATMLTRRCSPCCCAPLRSRGLEAVERLPGCDRLSASIWT